MTHVEFAFNPSAPDASQGLTERLECAFGAARWVHNKAMLRQWQELRACRVPPSLRVLTEECIDFPGSLPETAWLKTVPRGILIDELDDLTNGWDDLKEIRREKDLPLKKKREDQEIVFPRGTFTFIGGVGYEAHLLTLSMIGSVPIPLDIFAGVNDHPDAVKIERDVEGHYTATVYFE